MNEFTKEELEKIDSALMWWFQDSGFNQIEDYAEIRDKLQSLIDNYCEHEFKMNMHDAEWHCHKCGVIQ